MSTMLQQYLPFTVLKQPTLRLSQDTRIGVATVLTVYGIETSLIKKRMSLIFPLQQYLPFTVLKRRNSRKSLIVP